MTDSDGESNRTNIRPKAWKYPNPNYSPHMSFHDLPFSHFLLEG